MPSTPWQHDAGCPSPPQTHHTRLAPQQLPPTLPVLKALPVGGGRWALAVPYLGHDTEQPTTTQHPTTPQRHASPPPKDPKKPSTGAATGQRGSPSRTLFKESETEPLSCSSFIRAGWLLAGSVSTSHRQKGHKSSPCMYVVRRTPSTSIPGTRMCECTCIINK